MHQGRQTRSMGSGLAGLRNGRGELLAHLGQLVAQGVHGLGEFLQFQGNALGTKRSMQVHCWFPRGGSKVSHTVFAGIARQVGPLALSRWLQCCRPMLQRNEKRQPSRDIVTSVYPPGPNKSRTAVCADRPPPTIARVSVNLRY